MWQAPSSAVGQASLTGGKCLPAGLAVSEDGCNTGTARKEGQAEGLIPAQGWVLASAWFISFSDHDISGAERMSLGLGDLGLKSFKGKKFRV